MLIYRFLCFVILCSSLLACRKKELPTPASPTTTAPAPLPTKGSLNIVLKNVVGKQALQLDPTVVYKLSNGDEFSVRTYNYYLSNFVFTDENGNRYAEKESYHLAMASDPNSLNFTLKDVPFGSYKSLEFLIGVDSVRNFSGAQVGALDPKYGMFWTWSTGYIMAMLEGNSPQSANPSNVISFHIAGFVGENNVVQKVKLTLPADAVVTEKNSATITIQSNVAYWFESFTFPGFSKIPSVSVEGPNAVNIAQSYANMMSIISVENK